MTLYLFFSLFSACFAHMSMEFPRYRDRDSSNNLYEQWKLNEPMIPARPTVCHDLPSSTVPAENKFSANQVINVKLHGTVPHDGGHCSFWYSTNDIDFTKIVDIKDCTLPLGKDILVQIPDTLPTECGTKCTFAWTWVPTVSGLCEIYSNCADIQVSGLTGQTEANPQTINFQGLIDNNLCQRVDVNSHWSATFMPLKTSSTFVPSSTTTRAPTAPTTTTTMVPSPTPPPVTGTGIKITNVGTSGKWWYAATLSGIPAGLYLEYLMVESQGSWIYCTDDNSAGYIVYQCQPDATMPNGFIYPLSARFIASNGEQITATGVISNPNTGAVFYSNVNFNGNGNPTTTTTAAPAPTTTTTTTAAPAPTTSTTVSSTNAPSATTTTAVVSSTSSTTGNPVTTTGSGTGTSIILTTQGSPTDWFYSCEIEHVTTGFTVTSFQIAYNGNVATCRDGGFTGRLVYLCDSLSSALVYPLSVKIEANGQTLQVDAAVPNNNANAVFDLGVNFGSIGTTTPVTTLSTSATATATATATAPVTSTIASTGASSTVPSSTAQATSSTSSVPPTTSTKAASTTTKVQGTSSTTVPPTSSTDKEIIGYYPAWQWYDRSKLAAPMNMDFSKLTIVNFAFFQPDVNGNLFGTDEWADPQVLFGPIDWNGNDPSRFKCHYKAANTKDCNYHVLEEGLIDLVHSAGAKIFPSIGGWTLSDNFPVLAANPVSRQNFADQCVMLIEEYGFDGIDIDWEYPGYVAHSGTAADTVNFNLLLQDVRRALDTLGNQNGKYYQLTAALPCGPTLIDNIDVATVTQLLDQLNLMTYDFFGSWDSTVGINAPLYTPNGVAAEKQDFNVDSCVANWKSGGATNDKINIGLPFYGRSFAGATQLNQVHSGNDKAHWPDDEGIPQFFNIEKQLNQMTSVRDEQSKTQLAYFAGGGVVSYDDQRAICDKVEYAIDNSINGFIIWEITGDVRDDLSTPLLDEVHMKLDYPTTHVCGGSSGSAALVDDNQMDENQNESENVSAASSSLVYLSVSLFTVIISLAFNE